MIHLSDLSQILSGQTARGLFQALYGTGPAQLDMQRQRWMHLADLFCQTYPGQDQARLFSTPGRTEVGGNHTDHQHGRVLCAAVDMDIIAIAAPNQDQVIRLKSEGFNRTDLIDLADLQPAESEREHSASLIRGIAAAFRQRGYPVGGLDICTTSRVPKGSGLSSSAAFEVLVATILDDFYNGGRMPATEKALISQYAENVYFGKPCGLMDQCACAFGGFITIDFLRPEQPLVQTFDIDFEQTGHCLVITNTGGSHADLTDDYASVPRDMRQAAGLFGKTVLREVDPAVFWRELAQLRSRTTDPVLLRAIHFFQDNERVSAQTAALQENRFDDFLRLVRLSGISSWTRLQNVYSSSHPQEQPLSVALAVSEQILSGRGACRVHGGGFAGTIQAFVPLDLADDYLAAMNSLFGANSAWKMRIRPVGSARLEL
ncbi:MAG TPA: galactokinase [Clostridiales bacterium]|nr:galactokinase [Clostridiales bacterium]